MTNPGNNADCYWTHSCPAGQVASVHFTSFDTESNYDYVYAMACPSLDKMHCVFSFVVVLCAGTFMMAAKVQPNWAGSLEPPFQAILPPPVLISPYDLQAMVAYPPVVFQRRQLAAMEHAVVCNLGIMEPLE